MRGLLSLVGKEWRDVRAVTAASAVLVVLACLGVRWYLEERYGLSLTELPPTSRYFEYLVPACAALYATLIAADIVGGEVASRRIDLVELLPVGRSRVWTAKVLFLVVVTVAFLLWCVVVQAAALAAIDGAAFAEPFLAQVLAAPWMIGFVASFAGATLLASTIGLRGLSAAVVGGATAAALWTGAFQFAEFVGYGNTVPPATWFDRGARETVAACLLPPALLAAAGLAYAFGRVHLGSVLRPAAIALVVVAAMLTGPAAVMAHNALTVVPGEAGTSFDQAWPSPDGRFVALPFAKEEGPSRAAKVFILDTARDALVEPEFGNCTVEVVPPTWEGVWDADGNLVVASPGLSGVDRAWIDPRTGAVRRTETLDFAAAAERTRRRYEPWNEATRWSDVESRRAEDGGPTYVVTACDRRGSARREFRSWAPAAPRFPYRWLVYFPDPNVLAVRALPDGEERRLLTSREPWQGGWQDIGHASPDGRALLVRHDGTWKSLDVESGSATEIATHGVAPTWWYVYGDPSRRIVVLPRARASSVHLVDLVDLATGAKITMDSGDTGSPRAAGDGRLIVMRTGPVLDLMDRDLKFVRRLWPLAKE